MNRRPLALALLALNALVFLAAGCGSSTPSTIAVKGTLEYEDGKPISGASIRFISSIPGAREAAGSSGKDGTFDLSTFNSGDGAVVGDYTIVVTKVATSMDGGAVDNTPKNPADMINIGKKNLAGGAAAPKKVEDPVPAIYSDPKTSPLKWKIESSTSTITLKLKRS